ncbi:MAG: hypothetical protein IJP45_01090 [Paludibacteraceae bacterium]|nr:hypothetical protein [Paludibacteraceae bacterium]
MGERREKTAYDAGVMDEGRNRHGMPENKNGCRRDGHECSGRGGISDPPNVADAMLLVILWYACG